MRARAFALLLALVASAGSACRKKAPAEPAETSFDLPEFRITLAGGWTETARSQGYDFSNIAHTRQVLVSITPMLREDPRLAVDRLIAMRRSAAGGSAQHASTARVTTTRYEEKDGVLRARFQATDDAAGSFSSFLFIALRNESIEVAYYELAQHAENPVEAEGQAHAERIFSALSLK